MPTIQEVRQKFPQYDDLSDDQLATALHQKFYSDMPQAEFAQKIGLTTPGETRDGEGFFEKLDAGVRGAADMMTFGMADEISAGLGTGFGLLGDYDEELARQRGIDQFDAENNTGARVGGQVAGALTGGLGMAKNGLTLLGKAKTGAGSIGLAGTEGAAYGGLYGAGSGEGAKDRVRQGVIGAGVGALTGGAFQKVGNTLAARSASKAAAKAASASDELADATTQLYKRAEEAGVMIKPAATRKLTQNMRYAAGNANDKLRPNTSGMLDDLDEFSGQTITLQRLDELRQEVSQSMKRAQPQDVRTLSRMKEVLDNFESNIRPSDITGDIKGFEIIKQARALNARKMKTRLVESIIDQAQVDGSGQYSQSGAANAVRREMRSLYKKIKSGKEIGFTDAEVALIKQMASGKTSSAIMRLFAKFAPRGIVSFGVGQGVGTMIPGGNILLPGVGHFAAKSVDKAMVRGADALRNAAATGTAPPSQAISSTAGRLAGPAGEMLAATPQYLASPPPQIPHKPRLRQVSK